MVPWVGADAVGGQTRGAGTQRGGSAHRRTQRGLSWDEVGDPAIPPPPLAHLAVILVEGRRSALREEATNKQNKRGCLSPLERRDCVIEEGVIAVVLPPPSLVQCRGPEWAQLAFESTGGEQLTGNGKGGASSPLACTTASARRGQCNGFLPPLSLPRRRVFPRRARLVDRATRESPPPTAQSN